MSVSTIREMPFYLTVREAAEYLRVSKSYLDKLRVHGGGPAFIKIGSRVLYTVARLDEFMAAREYSNTSELASKIAA